MTDPARTIFLGSGAFAVPIAAALAEHPSVELAAVITAPAARGSRGRLTEPPVATWAEQRRLPTLRPARLRAPESIDEIRRLAPDFLVLADYGQIVPSALIDLPRHGALNLHPSLLPRHRGATPISAAILNGDGETGVSLMLMDAGLDTGPLIAQTRRLLTGSETAPQLEAELANAAAGLLVRSVDDWLTDRLKAVPQSVHGVTLTRPLRREDGRLDPMLPAERLERQVRAYQPWPASFIDTPAGRVIVWRAEVLAGGGSPGAGRLSETSSGGLALTTSDGILELVEAQPAGGRRMSGAELLRGRPALAGAPVLTRTEADQAG